MELLARHGARVEVDPVADWLGAVVRGIAPAAPRAELVAALRASDVELLPIMASAGEDAIVARLLDAGLPLDARGVDDGTALHYAGMWARPGTVALLLQRGADVDVVGGPHYAPGTALHWTAWGSRALPGAADRGEDYVAAARLLVAAGAAVTDEMVDNAADDVAELLQRTLRP
jgi:ankyrin repeat protein